MSCPEGMKCWPGFYPRLIKIDKNKFTVYVPPDPQGQTITLQCCQTKLSRDIPSDATEDDIAVIANEMIIECATQQAICDNITTGPPGVPPPVVPNPQPTEKFRNGSVSAQFPCAGTVAFTGTLPNWVSTMSFPGIALVFVGQEGVFSATTQAAADLFAAQTIDNLVQGYIAASQLSCVTINCLSQSGTIVLPTQTAMGSMIYTRDDALPRALFTGSFLVNNASNLVNTTNDSIVATTAINDVLTSNGIPQGCYASSAQAFFIPNNAAVPARSKLTRVDANTGAVSANFITIGSGSPIENVDYASIQDRLYAVKAFEFGDTETQIWTGTTVASVGFTGLGFLVGLVNGMSCRVPNRLVFYDTVSKLLYFYDLPGITLRGFIDMTPYGTVHGTTYADNTGKCYVGAAGTVVEIDPVTLSVDHVYTLTGTIWTLDYNPTNGALYAVNGSLITIDPVSRTVICTDGGRGTNTQGCINTTLNKFYAGNGTGTVEVFT